MKVVVMKLSDGAEIVTSLGDSTNGYVNVNKPRVLFHDGTQGGLMPYFISAPDQNDIPIAKNSIIASFDAPAELAKSYQQMTSTIQLLS